METIDQANEIKRVKTSLIINVPLCIFAMTNFIKGLEQHHTIKTVFSGAGFALFLFLIVLLLVRLRKLQAQ